MKAAKNARLVGILLAPLFLFFILLPAAQALQSPVYADDNAIADVREISVIEKLILSITGKPLSIALDSSALKAGSYVSGGVSVAADKKLCLSTENIVKIKFIIKNSAGTMFSTNSYNLAPIPCSGTGLLFTKFAVKLPSDTPAGTYTIVARIFDESNQDVTLLEASGVDSQIASFTVSSSGTEVSCPNTCGSWSDCLSQGSDKTWTQERLCYKLTGRNTCETVTEFRTCASPSDTGGDFGEPHTDFCAQNPADSSCIDIDKTGDTRTGLFQGFSIMTWILIAAAAFVVFMLWRKR